MTRFRLELISWTLFFLSMAVMVAIWALEPTGGWALLLFFSFIVTGVPGAMLSLHLHPPKFFRNLERPKR